MGRRHQMPVVSQVAECLKHSPAWTSALVSISERALLGEEVRFCFGLDTEYTMEEATPCAPPEEVVVSDDQPDLVLPGGSTFVVSKKKAPKIDEDDFKIGADCKLEPRK